MKEHAAYLRDLRQQGYLTVRKIHSNHLRIFCSRGHLVATHSANGGSDGRSLMNFKAEIRRHELWHCHRDDEAQEAGSGNPVGDRETRRDHRDKPQRAEHQCRDDQHPAKQSYVI